MSVNIRLELNYKARLRATCAHLTLSANENLTNDHHKRKLLPRARRRVDPLLASQIYETPHGKTRTKIPYFICRQKIRDNISVGRFVSYYNSAREGPCKFIAALVGVGSKRPHST